MTNPAAKVAQPFANGAGLGEQQGAVVLLLGGRQVVIWN